MRIRLSSWAEQLRASLFIVPMLGVIASVVLGITSLALDRHIDDVMQPLPFGITSTVDSARVLLSTVAGATITFAGIAFSVSLLLIQQASGQYSPRVVHTLFRDPFNKRVMAFVVGTFTYCLVVLRSVRSALEPGGDAVVPNVSVAVAVVLGISTILAVVAFINHSAHAMDVSEILERVRREAIQQAREDWPTPDGRRAAADSPPTEMSAPVPFTVRFARSGWVQQIDTEELLDLIPAGATMVVYTAAGRYAVAGTPLCALTSGVPDSVHASIRAAVGVGHTRTMQDDTSYGLRQLADVALKALSPGINDPTTAQDAIFHSAAVLQELLHRDPPASRVAGPEGRILLLTQQLTHESIVRLAFDEVRRASAPHPTVAIYLLEALDLLDESLRAAGLGERSAPLCEQARLTVAGCEAADHLPEDLAMVCDAYTKRFTDR